MGLPLHNMTNDEYTRWLEENHPEIAVRNEAFLESREDEQMGLGYEKACERFQSDLDSSEGLVKKLIEKNNKQSEEIKRLQPINLYKEHRIMMDEIGRTMINIDRELSEYCLTKDYKSGS